MTESVLTSGAEALEVDLFRLTYFSVEIDLTLTSKSVEFRGEKGAFEWVIPSYFILLHSCVV